MKNDAKIIKYIENELTPAERVAFETDLKNSIQLNEEFKKYLRVKKESGELKTLKLSPPYLDSVLPEFRNNIETPKSSSVKKNLGYAFGIMLVFILSIAILKNFFNKDSELIDIQEFTQSLNENQRIELLEELNGESEVYKIIPENISGNEFNSLLASGLELDNEVAEAYDISYNDLITGLSQEEVENIYSEILNRNF
jgi:hypothetical protein